ncbi:hypothetical protein CVT25_000993 [Psilocybe cyanescens]|uniref:Uncharacterized protein n=1 Tax=Psilocybe cyanescens TaxID=93625 RepID=A0A409XMD4_PSICY|nr:hypothetical protein CVT25_000993 [Psilocybe cyanescens]
MPAGLLNVLAFITNSQRRSLPQLRISDSYRLKCYCIDLVRSRLHLPSFIRFTIWSFSRPAPRALIYLPLMLTLRITLGYLFTFQLDAGLVTMSITFSSFEDLSTSQSKMDAVPPTYPVTAFSPRACPTLLQLGAWVALGL